MTNTLQGGRKLASHVFLAPLPIFVCEIFVQVISPV